MRAGQVVKVRVVEVDLARKRIARTMKLQAAPLRSSHDRNDRWGRDERHTFRPKQELVRNSAMADKLAALKRLRFA